MTAPVSQPPRRERAIAIAAAWLAFVGGLSIGGDIDSFAAFGISAATGAVLVIVGFAAAWRQRPLPRRALPQRVRLGLWAIAVGVACGLANLAANWLIAQRDPAIRTLLVERIATLNPVDGLITSPIVEEISVRLFLMSAVAWIAHHFTRRSGVAFVLGLIGSSIVFAALHLGRPFPGDPSLATYYRTTLLAKYTLAGLPLGWVFWRWGLPYSILCHAVVNGVHVALQSRVF